MNLKKQQNTIFKKKLKQIYIFDLDGTLYQLDGQNNGYSGSTIEKIINQNILKYIRNRESCTKKIAQEIFNQAIVDPVGASQYLSNKYQISRAEYFNIVWDIDPQNIVKNYNFAQEVISNIDSNIKLILLTSAPKIWAERVLFFLGIKDKFERIITGEEYKYKDEIFQDLATKYNPNKITSIGDQYKTDIQPAELLGFKSLLIQKPKDITNLSK